MTISLFSVTTPLPPPPQSLLYKYCSNPCSILSYPSSPSSSKLFVPLCSPSSPVIEEEGPSSPDELPIPNQSQFAAIQSGGGCQACGKEEIEKGCNGEGRIQGGIATVPGFGWWPIKAYRPCPGFVASGGRYRRKGQSMDEVAAGRSQTPPPSDSNKLKSNKKQDPKKSKR